MTDMKIIFLDRDGVINQDPVFNGQDPGLNGREPGLNGREPGFNGQGPSFNSAYVTRWEQFKFLPGSLEAIRKLTESGYEIFVISNQSGVAKGLFGWDALEHITKNMLEEVEADGGKISSVLYCPHRDEDNCDCKKPKAGLFRKAVEGKDVEFEKTFLVGDDRRDIEAGKAVGCKTIMVLSGKTKLKDKDNWAIQPDFVAKDLLEAVEKIVLEKK